MSGEAQAQEREQAQASGVLYLVATPVGNLRDMTFRGVEILRSADLIAAEDVRRSRILLKEYDINTPLVSCHEHNERATAASLVRRLRRGKKLALISDAGTPLLSDPGYPLVREAIGAKIPVVPVPGASSLLAALTGSGMSMHRFHYLGFLPAAPVARQKQLRQLKWLPNTLVFLESPHRLPDCLADMRELLGGARLACIARELTKLHEEFLRGSLDELAAVLAQRLAQSKRIRGECVLLVEGATATAGQTNAALSEWLDLLGPELPPARLAALLQKLTGVSRRTIYQTLLEWRANRAAD